MKKPLLIYYYIRAGLRLLFTTKHKNVWDFFFDARLIWTRFDLWYHTHASDGDVKYWGEGKDIST
jgi:hypothetical protein